MEMRVQGKLRAFRQQYAMMIPWHLHTFKSPSSLERIPTHGNLCGVIKCRKSDKGIIAPYRLFQISSE